MGGGISLSSLPTKLNEEEVRKLCGDDFDQESFDDLKDENGFITKQQFMEEIGHPHSHHHSARPIAVIYRGLATAEGCPEVCATALEGPYQIKYAGPAYSDILAALNDPSEKAALYVQPGGGDNMEVGWNAVKDFSEGLKSWVQKGGHYIGICMGGYLAGTEPGFGLLEGWESASYTETEGAEVTDMKDALVTVHWRDVHRQVYFQGGPCFKPCDDCDRGKAVVLATYSNNQVAALALPLGNGSVGVCGPHPEAPSDWYTDIGGKAVTELFVDLVATTCNIHSTY